MEHRFAGTSRSVACLLSLMLTMGPDVRAQDALDPIPATEAEIAEAEALEGESVEEAAAEAAAEAVAEAEEAAREVESLRQAGAMQEAEAARQAEAAEAAKGAEKQPSNGPSTENMNAPPGDQTKPASRDRAIHAEPKLMAPANGDHQRIEALPNGRVRIPSLPQEIEAEAAPAGIVVRSTAPGEHGSFSLRAVEIGRTGSQAEKVSRGRVIIEGGTVHIFRPNISEELTTSAEGVRQDFVISAAPSGRGELQLVLEARGARITPTGEAISLTLPNGRVLLYHELKATDSEGKVLPAHFQPEGDARVRIGVDDRGARYPVRIDPTITDAEWPSVAQLGFRYVR